MDVIVKLVILAGIIIILEKYYFFAFKDKVPQSPAALGKAFAAPTFILAISLYALNIFQGWFFGDIPMYACIGSAVAVLSAFIAGWVSARTSEDTQSMNLKIISVIGIFPFTLVVAIGFMGHQSSLVIGLVAAFIPVLVSGGLVYRKYAQ
ncbi:MAG: hypothetical protein AseanaTS_03690 [Candidatus Pelagadaptatus aseana]|uniref:hypothetical protein n=1 Tax=Candidatus Pelagadaptatus aseana TaxID=3120508 RepID=UPI0039B296AF